MSRRVSPAPLVLLAATLALVGAGVAGCGNSRTRAPTLSEPAGPSGFRTLGYPADGVALLAPRNWAIAAVRAPLVTVFSSGAAVVALWRYDRSTEPSGAAALRQAREMLVADAHTRDASLRLIRSSILRIDRHGAVELDAFERIGRQSRRVRSTHVYLPHAELVLDEYAPPDLFHEIDHEVFSPVKRSLRLIRSARP